MILQTNFSYVLNKIYEFSFFWEKLNEFIKSNFGVMVSVSKSSQLVWIVDKY